LSLIEILLCRDWGRSTFCTRKKKSQLKKKLKLVEVLARRRITTEEARGKLYCVAKGKRVPTRLVTLTTTKGQTEGRGGGGVMGVTSETGRKGLGIKVERGRGESYKEL